MQKITFPLIKFFFWVSGFASISLSAQQTFQKTLGGASDEYGYATEQLSSGGYIMCGRTISYGVGGFDNYLVKFNANGDTLWTKTYGNVGYDEAQSIKQTLDGGFILTGQTDNIDWAGDVYLVKTDSNGVVSWSTAFGGAGTSDFGYSVRQTSDGGYIVAGLSASSGSGQRDVFLVKTSSTGALQWSKNYGGSLVDEGRTVEQTADGGYIIAGFTQSYGNGLQAYIIKTNSAGVLTWSKNFGGGGTELAYSIKQTSDGGYILAGYTDTYGAGQFDALLMKLTSAGGISWSKTYGGTGDDYGLNLKITADSGYVICGRAGSFGGGGGDYYIVKTNALGAHQWSKTYGGTAIDQAGNIIQTADGGYFLTGYTMSFGAGIRDAYVVKTDGLGNSGCAQFSTTTITNNPVVSSGTGATETNGVGFVSPVTATRRTGSIIGVQCSSVATCVISASFSASAINICEGTSVSFTNTSVGATSYQWTENTVSFATTNNASRYFNSAGTFTIKLLVINGACKDSATAIINVSALPVCSLVAGGPTTFCQGGSVTLTASGGFNYVWLPGGQTSPTITVTTPGNYSASTTNANNCSGSSNTISVLVNPLPLAAANNTGPYCVNSNVSLSATGGGSYAWSGTNAFSSTLQNPIIPSANIGAGGVYTVTVTVGGCSSIATTTVIVNPTPIITLISSPQNYCMTDGPDSLIGSPLLGQWSGVGVVGNTFNPVTAGPGAHTIFYVYTDANGCSGVDSLVMSVSVCLSVISSANTEKIILFPNPATSFIEIKNNKIGSVVILDVSGRVVLKQKDSLNSINISLLEKGFYFLILFSEDGLYKKTFIKE